MLCVKERDSNDEETASIDSSDAEEEEEEEEALELCAQESDSGTNSETSPAEID